MTGQSNSAFTPPQVSIIIPYNKDRGWLQVAIDSIHKQDYLGDIQLLLEQSDNPVGYNINRGIEKATGKYIKYFAEDDWLEPTCISASVKFLESTPYRWMHACSNIIHSTGRRGIHIPPFNPTFEQLLDFNHIHGGTVMYERSLFDEVGLFDESLMTGEEYDFYLKLYSKGIAPGYIEEVVFNYRRHPGQKSLGNTEESYQAWRRAVVEQIRNRYRK